MHLTARDQCILVRLSCYRLLTSHQIEALLFHTGKSPRSLKSQCQRRLQLLFHHGYVTRLPIRMVITIGAVGECFGRQPFVYALDRRGAELVARLRGISLTALDYPRKPRIKDWNRLTHDLANNDTWVIIDRLAQAQQIALKHWLTGRHLKADSFQDRLPAIHVQGVSKRKVPDSYFALQFPHHPQPAHFFYEEDRDTEKTKPEWQEKVTAYIHFRNSGRAAQHFNCRNFRVLTKTTDQRRLNQLKRWSQETGGTYLFWFITEEDVAIWHPQTFLQSIWQVAGTTGHYPLTLSDISELTPDQ